MSGDNWRSFNRSIFHRWKSQDVRNNVNRAIIPAI